MEPAAHQVVGGDRVAGGAHVWPSPGPRRTVPRQQIPELALLELLELVEANERDLGASPLQRVLRVLHVRERDGHTSRESILEVVLVRDPVEWMKRVELGRLIPQAALILDLRIGAPEDDRTEGTVVDVANRLQQESPRLPAAG